MRRVLCWLGLHRWGPGPVSYFAQHGLFQDDAGKMPTTQDGQPVAVWHPLKEGSVCTQCGRKR